ncbi:MAG: NADP-dependent oxidoreductase [Chlamydiales bacterium]|nr:NADP-dependent oxidoreductase [Chlamydiales bacterium]
MRAIVIEEFGGAEQLKLKDVEIPTPNEQEVQIEVFYAGVNPVDWKIREGLLKERLPHKFPLILGWDVAGKITQVGRDVKELKVGDSVFAYTRKPVAQFGTYAEYVCFDAKDVAIKPKNISFAESSAIPLITLTAWQSLFDAAKLKRGESILIHAGSGGVGSVAIQLAKYAGAKVYTTASKHKHEYVKSLGADVVIDYTDESFVEVVKSHEKNGVDVVFDCVGSDTCEQSLHVIKSGGRLVSILEHVDKKTAEEYEIEAFYVFVAPNGKELKEIAGLIEQGRLRPPLVQERPLREAKMAQEELQLGKVTGKIVLKVKE